MKTLFYLLLAICLAKFGFAQCNFHPVGCDDFNQESYGPIALSSIAIDATGIPYIAFSDAVNSNKITVKKYVGTSWVTVGNAGFSSGTADNISIVFDGSNIPYVLFKVSGVTASVMKFNGAAWAYVGNQTITSSYLYNPDIALDPAGTPYIVFKDGQNGLGYRVSVMKFNGTSWVYVGTQGFSANSVEGTSIAFDAAGTPYVAYGDYSLGYSAVVMKFNGVSWVPVGNPGFSANGVSSGYPAIIEIDPAGTPYVIAGGDVMKFNGTSWITIGASVVNGRGSMILDNAGVPYIVHQNTNNNGIVQKYNGVSWVTVGNAPIAVEYADYMSVALNSSGTPYILYQDSKNKYKAVVMTLVNNIWVRLTGSAVSEQTADKTSIALDKNDVPYILYSDYSNAGKLTVKKHNGSQWTTLGNAGFSISTANYTSLALDTNSVPYVFYNENSPSGPPTVKKFNGTSWVNVGTLAYTLASNHHHSIAIDPVSNSPYILYCSGQDGYKAKLMKYNGTAWVTLGFSPVYSDLSSVAIDNTGTPYIAFQDYSSHAITVMKYNGTSMVVVGSAGFAPYAQDYLSLAIDNNGTPYIAYADMAGSNNHKCTVMKYNGASWVHVGSQAFTASGAYEGSLAIDGNGNPYVAFEDQANGDKATVMKFNGSSWVIVGNAGFSAGTAESTDIVIDKAGNPYVAYSFGKAYVHMSGLQTSLNYSNHICAGTNINLSASGGNTYSWIGPGNFNSSVPSPTIANSSTLNTGNYSVTISTGSCSVTRSFSVTINTGCQDVWPGDANSDGAADNLDILELGLHYTQTGPSRTTISNSWQSYVANNWSGTISNGKNLNHSDCNGDGTIDDNDTSAIFNNYGLTHTFKPGQQTVINPQLSIVPDQPAVVKGTWGTASVYLGDASNPISNINGLAFTINFDNTLIETNSIWIEYPTSFINASNQNLKFRKLDFGNNNLYTATTHTVTNNVSGNGLIAMLHYQIKSSLTTDQILNLGIVQVNQSDASGNIIPLTSGTGTLMAMGSSVGVNELSNGALISISPNPAQSTVSISSTTDLERVEIVNLTGQVLISEPVGEKTHRLNVENLVNGVYFVKVYNSSKQVVLRKLVIQK